MKFIEQHDEKDCGIACLAMIAKYYGANYSFQQIRNYSKTNINGTTLLGIVTAAEKMGFIAEASKGNLEELTDACKNAEINFPFIAHLKSDHFVIVKRIRNKYVNIIDPAIGKRKISIEEFEIIWSGIVISLRKDVTFFKYRKKKYLLILIKQNFVKYKFTILKIQFISFIISLISVMGSFIFQFMIDDKMNADKHVHEFESIGQQKNLLVRFINSLSEADNIQLFFNALTILYFIQFALFLFRNIAIAKLERKMDLQFIQDYFLRTIEKPIDRIKSHTVGDHLSRLYDSEKIKNAVSTTIFSIFFDLLFVIISVIALCKINLTMFLKTTYYIIIYVFLYILFRRPQETKNREILENNAKLASYYKEIIEGIETIKTASYVDNIKKNIKEKYSQKANSILKYQIILSIQQSVFLILDTIGILLLIRYGLGLVETKFITIGQLISYYIILGFFIEPLKDIIKCQSTLHAGRVALDRLEEVVSYESETQNEGFSNGNIEFRNVTFGYGYNEYVLEDINCVINKSEKIAIVGESGSGKSTFAKLLLAENQIENGKILINNISVFDINEKELYSNISYVSQDVIIFQNTLKENILMNRNISNSKLDNIVRLCDLTEFVQSLPNGLETIIDENGYNISGGQRARISLARALISSPSILILDEFTSNLDPVTERKINETIFGLNCTTIIVSHRLSQIVQCDKVLFIKKGRVIGFDSHDNLLSLEEYRCLWDNQ